MPQHPRRSGRSTITATLAVLATLAASACTDASRATEPRLVAGARSVARDMGGMVRQVSMMDACDQATFDAALNDPSGCLRTAGVTFAAFVAELQRSGVAGAWHFAPSVMDATAGTTLEALNRGGETHTFTRVAAFGGGIVPFLNGLSHNPVPAPECTMLEDDDFVAPGESYLATVGSGDTELYQCCIHPWMRAVVHVHRG